jgi:hypothetical protein
MVAVVRIEGRQSKKRPHVGAPLNGSRGEDALVPPPLADSQGDGAGEKSALISL